MSRITQSAYGGRFRNVTEKNQIKGESIVQIGGIKREKKADKSMAVAE